MVKHIILGFTATISILGFGQTAAVIADVIVPGTDNLEIIVEFSPENPPGNIAVTPDGRLVMSQHQFFGADDRVVEILTDGTTRPFPNSSWSQAPDTNGVGLNNVLGISADRRGVVWMLDRSPGAGEAGRLIGWDTQTEQLHRIIYLAPPLIPENAFLNDLAIDDYHNAIYIADTAAGYNSALIVVDLNTGYVRRVLEGDISTRPENIQMVIDDRVITLGPEEARVGVNPITIDPNNEWVYYGPMSGRSLYRIRTRDLLDLSLSPLELATRVERYGDRPISDGITVDGAGNVYITDITHNAIGVVEPSGQYRLLYQNDMFLSWPDGFSVGPDNFIYVTANQLHRSAPLNKGENESVPPFYLMRFPALEATVVGR